MQAQPQASRLFPNGLRELLSVLFEEEQQAYSSAMQRATDRCAPTPAARQRPLRCNLHC